MKNKTTLIVFCTVTTLLVNCTKPNQTINEVVNPLIGSGGHGHVFVGASSPHGMVQVGPSNPNKGWDWSSGYHYSDSVIVGFTQNHLSGTGIGDLGEICLMPKLKDQDPNNYTSIIYQYDDLLRPYLYQAYLKESGVEVALTATPRVAIHQYLFPEDGHPAILVDLSVGAQSILSREGTLECSFALLNDSTLVGSRTSNEWADNQTVYFALRLNTPIQSIEYFDGLVGRNNAKKMAHIKAQLHFEFDAKKIMAKCALSYKSIKGALDNLQQEAQSNQFNSYSNAARIAWEEQLNTIAFESYNPEYVTQFYTALYHTAIAPTLFSDANHTESERIYSTFSLWDTYRSLHPLYTLIEPRTSDFINSLIAIGEQQGTLPVWHLVGHETNCMVGIHSIPVIADAALKRVPGVNPQKALTAISQFETYTIPELQAIRNQNYLPADKYDWSVAKGLEYCVDEAAIAALAADLGASMLAQTSGQRAKNYRIYFDSNSKFMRGRLADGSFRSPFDPSHSIHMEDDFLEGNAWQYTFMVPHDIDGLIDLFGSKAAFRSKLDSLFSAESHLNTGASADITGMIGQYAHGNEPSHHIAYLYSYIGEVWKSAPIIRTIIDSLYTNTPDGIIGNEDCGAMSSWYIFSSLGFYPVEPTGGTYRFGTPTCTKATLKLINGKTFTIEAKRNSSENIYIQYVFLNGKPYKKPYITHRDIMNGGKLIYIMGNQPKKAFGND